MGTYSVGDKDYKTEDFTPKQKNLVSSLSFVKEFTNEKLIKHDILTKHRDVLLTLLAEKFGSKIIEIDTSSNIKALTLEDGSEHRFEKLEIETSNQVIALSFLDTEITETFNILQIFDTAKITYSKEFYVTLK